MMTSSNENIFRVTGPLCGECTGHRWIPRTKPVTRSFDVFFDLRLEQQLSKQWRRWWFETPSRSLWRRCNENHVIQWHARVRGEIFTGNKTESIGCWQGRVIICWIQSEQKSFPLQFCTGDTAFHSTSKQNYCNVINDSCDRIDPFGFIVWATYENKLGVTVRVG